MGEKSASPLPETPGTLGGSRFERGKALARRAREIVPGGTHTYAKGDDQYPLRAPAFLARGMSMGQLFGLCGIATLPVAGISAWILRRTLAKLVDA